jgi:hypothetical protein
MSGLWTGLLAAPLAWLATLEAAYALVPWACGTNRTIVLHLVTGLGGLAVVVATIASWRAWARHAGAPDDGPGAARRRFTAGLGVAVALLFVLVVIATEVPAFVLGACD